MTSNRRWLAIARLVVAGVLGYALIVLLTTLGFTHWLGDPDFYRAAWPLKAKGILVALFSGLAGGALAALVGGHRPLRHTLAVMPLLAADTTYVLFFFPRTDPAWFSLSSSLALIGATLLGGFLVSRARRRRASPPLPA